MYRIEDQPAALREVQRLLGINQTAFYDKPTRDAVIEIQTKFDLEPNGVTDYLTFNAIVENHKMSVSENANNQYLFTPTFPYKKGDMDDNVGTINDILSIVLKNYRYDGNIPTGKYFGDDTIEAVIYLRYVFKMRVSEEIDAQFMNRLIFEKNAIGIKSTY